MTKREVKLSTIREIFASGKCSFQTLWDASVSRIDAKGVYVMGKEVKGHTPSRFFNNAKDTGVIQNMPNEDYHRERQHVSSSALKVFDANPKKYHRCYVKQDEQPEESKGSEAKLIGSVVHSMLLDDPAVWGGLYDFLPLEVDGLELNLRLKNHREFIAGLEAEAKANGVTLLTPDQYDTAEKLVGAANENKVISRLLNYEGAYKEVSGFTADPDSGQRIKARFDTVCRYDGDPELIKDIGDWKPGDLIIPDIKTSESQHPEQFVVRDVVNYGYHISGALYRKVFFLITGYMPRFWWIVLAKDKDGDCHSYITTLSDDDWFAASLQVDKMLMDLARSNLGGTFISPFANRVNIARLPHYLRNKGDK